MLANQDWRFAMNGPFDPTDYDYIPPGEPIDIKAWRSGHDAKTTVVPAQGKRGGDFLRSYIPLSYVIDGVLPSGYLYGITAKPGGGKTAFLITAMLAVITGRTSVLGFAVRKGRVAYIAKENPFDIKMKIAVNCYRHNVDWETLDASLFVFDGRDEMPEAIAAALKADAEANGEFALVNYDTFQAGFAATGSGAFNENEDVLRFVLRLRPLTEVPGKPAVLVAFHPTKNADEEKLIPYGGGSTYNEIDGNLTLWEEQGKSNYIGTAFAGRHSSHAFLGLKNFPAPTSLMTKVGKFYCPSCSECPIKTPTNAIKPTQI
jgi:AAA domain